MCSRLLRQLENGIPDADAVFITRVGVRYTSERENLISIVDLHL